MSKKTENTEVPETKNEVSTENVTNTESVSNEGNLESLEPTETLSEDKVKVQVNFGVYIPSMQKSFSKEEIEADQNIIDYLLSIGSGAVTEIKG